MARTRPGSGMPGLWTPPPARVMGDRLLKAKQAEQRIRDAEAKAKAEIAQQAEEEKADLREKVEEVEERFDRLVDDLPKMMPASGGGKRTIKKVLERDFDIDLGFSGEVVKHTAQTLTSGQQTQARSNIGAEATLPHTASTMLRRNAANNGFEARTLSEVNSDLGRFLTRAAAQAGGATSPLSFLNVAGYSAAGDGGDALYRKVSAALTTHQSYFQDSAGAYYELVDTHNGAMANGAVSTRVLGPTTRADNSAAFLRAFRRSRAAGHNLLAIERGWFPVESLTSLVTDPLAAGTPEDMSPGVHIKGAGMDETVIDWHDGTVAGQQDPVTPVHLFYRLPSAPALEYLIIEDLTITSNLQDSHSITSSGANRAYCMLLRNVDRLIFRNVKWIDIRDSALEARTAKQVTILNCEAHRIARAGFNVADCSNFLAMGNVITQTDDDAIALHTVPSGTVPHSAVVVGNRMVDTLTGLNMLGIKNAVIADNQVARPRFRGLSIGFEWSYDDPGTPTIDESTITEGATTNMGVSIHDNVISDLINRQTIDIFHDTPIGIHVRNIARSAGASLAAAPGRNDTTTSTVIPVAPHVWVNGSTAFGTDPLAPQPGSFGLSVKNNKVISMREPTGTYEEMFGAQMFSKAGWQNPTMTEAILRTGWGICIRGPHHGADISGNTIVGQFHGITNAKPASSLGGADGATLIDSRISHNIINRITSTSVAAYPMYLVPEGSEEDWLGTLVEGNIIDGDPEGRHYARVRPGTGSALRFDGTWSAAGALPGIYAPNVKGVNYRGNHFRNVSRAFNKHADTLAWDNVLYCYPAAVGTYDANNKGIGHIPSPGEGFKFVIVGCDPSSADFNKVLNVCLETSTAEPTSGLYPAGHIVRDSLMPIAAGQMRIGWRRTTTSSVHGASDWVEMKVDVV